MKKTKLLKSLLMAAALLVGANAWADTGDVTTNANIDFSNDVADGAIAGTVNSITIGGDNTAKGTNGDGNLILGKGTNTVTIPEAQYAGTRDKVTISFDIAFGKLTGREVFFNAKDKDGNAIFNVSYNVYSNSFSANTLEVSGDDWYHGYNTVIWARSATITINIDYATKKIITDVKNNYSNSTTSHTTDLSNTNPVATFNVGSNYDNDGRRCEFDNLLIMTTEGDYDVASADYTINYIFGGETIKTVTGTEVVGNTISAESPITIDNTKYYAADGATTSLEITSGTNTLNVTLREAEVWTYYVKAFKGSTELMTISTNTVVEGETASYGYPQYIAVDGVLYKANAQSSNPWWGESYTITENNAVRGFQYAEEGNEGIVFCSEAEDIDGLTVVSGGNTDIRASNRKGAYATAETKITTLEPGIYRVFGATYGNAGITFTLTAGDATVFTVATSGNPVHTTGDYFLITETTDLVMPAAGNGGNSPKMMDYIIVQKAGEYYETMSIVGDFSDGAWDATQGISMTRSAENPFEWTAVVNNYTVYSSDMWFEYKAVANENWDDYVLGNPNATNANNNQEYNFDYDGAREGIYTLTFTVNTQAHSLELAIEKQVTAQVYFVNTSDWAAPYIWVWDANNSDYNYTGGSWPGVAMTATGEQQDGHDVYTWSTYDITGTPTNIIFSNNGTDQTGDFIFEDGAVYSKSGISTVSKTITAAGYATFCSSSAVDFSSTAGLTAYIAKQDGTKVTFTEVTKVPANTGVLLKGGAGDYTISTTTEATDNVEGNILVGVTADTKVAAGSFVLMNGTEGVGFYRTTKEFTVGANTAYIEAQNLSEARSFIAINFDGTTTAIEGVATQSVNNGVVYDLQGRRVAAPQSGLYIINGKKVVIK